MPSLSDYTQFFGGQAFGTTKLPETDLSGKAIVITGGNSGLGFDCAQHLARLGVSRLILGCRDCTKGEDAKARILSQPQPHNGLSIDVWPIDLDSYISVVAFAKRVRSDLSRVDAFIVNAGVEPQAFSLSEGIERTLTVNVVSTYLSILGVLPKLRETSDKLGQQTTLTVVGSMAHLLADGSELSIGDDEQIFEALSDPKRTKMESRYPLSKLMSMLLFQELVERMGSVALDKTAPCKSVVANIVNPGWCDTGLHRYKSPQAMERLAFSVLGRTSEQGSRTLVDAVCAGPETHGRYLSECVVKPPSSYVRSENGIRMRGRLWDQTLQMIRLIWPEAADDVVCSITA